MCAIDIKEQLFCTKINTRNDYDFVENKYVKYVY